MMGAWQQTYDPLGMPLASSAVAVLPLAVLLGGLAFLRWRAHVAAIAGLMTALAVAIATFGMPVDRAVAAAGFGAASGLLPIGWIVLNIIFLYRLTEERGAFSVMRDSIAHITRDSRLQLLLIAFCFGAFFEGAAGFGTPVAVTGAMLIGLGFSRLQASCLSLIANTAPVAFGALGTPLLTLATVTGLPLGDLSAVVGRLMAPFCLLIPLWLIVAYCGWRRALEVWPAIIVTGGTYALAQLLISNLHGPWLAAIGSALISMVALVLLLRWWSPPSLYAAEGAASAQEILSAGASSQAGSEGAACSRSLAWRPWVLLTVLVFVWGLPMVKRLLDAIASFPIAVPRLDGAIARMPPVVPAMQVEHAVYMCNPLSATGTAILLAGLCSGAMLGVGPAAMLRCYGRTLKAVTPSLLTITAMLALGYVTRFSGIDATLGLSFAATGVAYPFFGTMLGWLGTAVTGSDTASNVLFGSLQTITANQLGLSALLMAAANSAGGVMGKMIDAQSIVVASTATRWEGAEGSILRRVFVHSLVLGAMLGLLVLLVAYVPPFTMLAIP